MVVSNNNGTYNILGLKPNEYRLLQQLVEYWSGSNHTMEDSDEALLKSLCESINCKYVKPISNSEWEDIENIKI